MLLRISDLVEDAAEPIPEAVVLLGGNRKLATKLVLLDVLQIPSTKKAFVCFIYGTDTEHEHWFYVPCGESATRLERVLLCLFEVVQLQSVGKGCRHVSAPFG